MQTNEYQEARALIALARVRLTELEELFHASVESNGSGIEIDSLQDFEAMSQLSESVQIYFNRFNNILGI